MNSRLYERFSCPHCGASPRPALARCPGCNRKVLGAGGELDLLSDDSRAAADTFASQYRALRSVEGWVGINGREDPEGGLSRLWRHRVESVTEAAAILGREWPAGVRPVVADIGSGGGWAERLLGNADVIAIDLLGGQTSAALTVRGDMRKLPLRDQSVDAALYAASLHYAPVNDAISEAARILAPGSLLIAIDSPLYPDPVARTRAMERAAAYYRNAGYPDLAAHYHPIDASELRSVLSGCGFRIERLDAAPAAGRLWGRLTKHSPTSFVVARRTNQVAIGQTGMSGSG